MPSRRHHLRSHRYPCLARFLQNLFVSLLIALPFSVLSTLRSQPPPTSTSSGTIELGQSNTIILRVPVPPDTTYQWFKDGTLIAGATTNSYAIVAATPADAGTYLTSFTYDGTTSSSAFVVIVKPAAAPVITTQPRATTAVAGQSVAFSFVATGSFPRTYQWRKDGNDLVGATAATLSLPGLTTASAGAYTVAVTNSLGSAVSASAALTVNAATPPVISITSPGDATLTQGQPLSLFVNLNSGSSPFTYQWLKGGTAVAGATGAQLGFTAITLGDAGQYSVTVTNIVGSTTSRQATVTVNPATAVRISTHPRAVTVFDGQPASFSASVTGSSPFMYQWAKDGASISGATSSSFDLSAARPAHGGNYTVTVSNVLGAATSSPALLTVNPPTLPRITAEPEDAEEVEGNSHVLRAAAEGSPPLTYQWFFNGTAIASATNSFLALSSLSFAHAGNYHAVATTPAGSAPSRSARISVLPLPAPIAVSLYTRPAALGGTATIGIDILGFDTAFTYQWHKDGRPVAGATNSTLTIGSLRAEDAGEYFVVIANPGGATPSRTIKLALNWPSAPPAGGWVAAERGRDFVYFAFTNPALIERFHLPSGNWFQPLMLPRVPAALAVSDDFIYVASGSTIYRYTLDGERETVVSSAFSSEITGLVLMRGALVAQTRTGVLASVRLADGRYFAPDPFYGNWSPNLAAAPALGRIYSRIVNVWPARIAKTTVAADGTIARWDPSSAPRDVPNGTRVFVSPDEAYVVDDGGTIYRGDDLRLVAALGGPLDDITFTSANRIVALARGQIIVHDERFLETGRIATSLANAVRIFVDGQTVHIFGYPPAGNRTQHAAVSLNQAGPAAVAPSVDASQLGFTPDAAFVDRTGLLYLYSKLHRQLFRWSPATRSYLAPIPLQGAPNTVLYSPSLHRVYLGYGDARILQIKLDAASPREEPFIVAPRVFLGFGLAGEYVMVAEYFGASGGSYYTFATDGRLVAAQSGSCPAREYVWNPVLRRMYQFRDGYQPDDLLYNEVRADGTFGSQVDSPFHGEIETRYPIRVTPDGSSVLLGSGRFYHAATMTPKAALANRINDAVWMGDRLFTGRNGPAGAEIQRWTGAAYTLNASKVLGGRVLRIFALSDARIVAITVREPAITLTLLDSDLNVLSSDTAGEPNRLANLAARAMVGRGDQILIPGFVVAGTQSKRVLIRAAGPALNAFGVDGALADPLLTVFNSAGASIATNNDWGTATNIVELTASTTKVGAFAFSAGSRDAAALVTLQPGAYTVQTRGANDTTGVALVEIYDAQDTGSSSRLVNIAARAQVGTGADVLIPGIVIQGQAPKTVLVRAIGPGLSQFGVTGVLADPRLRLFRGDQVLHENDDWGLASGLTAGRIVTAAAQVGAFALTVGSRDSALLVTLPPGLYTAQVEGVGGTSGVALVEVYEVP